MEKTKIEIKEFVFFGILFIGIILLTLLKVFNTNQSALVIIFIISYFLIKTIFFEYLNFVIQVRNSNFFPDNRTASFLTFDFLKSVLIVFALITILILGINKVLNNETIATLLGGLVGSLLTIKGSYTDIKLSKKNLESFQQKPTKNE